MRLLCRPVCLLSCFSSLPCPSSPSFCVLFVCIFRGVRSAWYLLLADLRLLVISGNVRGIFGKRIALLASFPFPFLLRPFPAGDPCTPVSSSAGNAVPLLFVSLRQCFSTLFVALQYEQIFSGLHTLRCIIESIHRLYLFS